MKYLGTKVGNGLGIGKIFIIDETIPVINNKKIETDSIDNEIYKVDQAINKSIESYNNIIESLVDEDLKQLCEFNKMVLMAKSLKNKIYEQINNLDNGAYALESYFNEKVKELENTSNNYLRQRSTDIIDIKNKVLKEYLNIKSFDVDELVENTILVAKEITPNILLSGNLSKVKGIISEIGGKTSHVGILSTTLNIPSVFGIENVIEKLKNDELVFINGNKGYVETELNEDNKKEIENMIKKENEINNELIKMDYEKAITLDGVRFEVTANTGDLVELDKIDANKIDGIGLFRTEFLYLNKQVPPTEEYLFSIFKSFAEKLEGKKLIIRTLDIGGDKKCSYIEIGDEANPFLGYRAIRYCLDHEEFFKTSLKAILRASAFGKILIMYPMISSLEDIMNANKILDRAKTELDDLNIDYDKNIKIGVMVEIPSIAICANEIIKHVDFFSIGTNDLVQYTLAVDRVNPNVSNYYNWFNPSVLKLIKFTIDSKSNNKDKFVGMCGEFAADPLGVILLVGLGLNEFSVNLSSLNKIKKYITLLNYKETKSFVDEILKLNSTKEIEEKLDIFAKEKFGKYYN